MPERKKRKASTSRKRKKRTDVGIHVKSVRQSENYADGVMSAMKDPLVVLDADFHVISANKAFCETYSAKQSDFEGRVFFELGDRTWDLPVIREKLNEVLVKGKSLDGLSVECDFPLIGRRSLLINASPLTSKANQAKMLVLTVNDVTKLKKAEEEIVSLSRFPSENPNVVMRISKEGNLLYSNNAGLPILTEWKCQVGQPVPDEWRQLVAEVLKSGRKGEVEEEHHAQTFLMMFAPIVDPGYVNVYGRDITERKKAEHKILRQNLLLQGMNRIFEEALGPKDEESLGGICLSVAEELTASKFGFIGEINEKGLQDIAISNPGWEACAMTEQSGHRRLFGNFPIRGLYGHVILSGRGFFTNDPASHAESAGTPAGHPPLRSFLGVPLKREDRAIGIIAVANREDGYTKEELDLLETLSSAVVEAFMRKRAEESLRRAYDGLEMRVEERTKELSKASEKLLGEIGERKRAEEAVIAERQRFNDVLEKLPAYLILLTSDYHVSYANRFFRERFGEAGGKRCFEFLFGRCEPCENCETYKTLKKMAPLEWEWTGPDGRNYYIYDSPFTDADGSTLIMEVGIDITERKKAEEKLRVASLYSRNLIEASLDPLVTIAADGKITDVNRSTEEVTGFSRDQLVGSDFSDYFTEPEKARRGYQQVFTEGFVKDYPLAIRNKNGRIVDVLYNATVYRNEIGEIQGIFAAARDITERKRAEEALRKAHDQLEIHVQERTRELSETTKELQADIVERQKVEAALRESQSDLNRAQAVGRIGSWRLDVRNSRLIWSDETYRMFGISMGTPMTYDAFLSIVHPEDREYVDKMWQAATKGEPYNIEHRIIVNEEIKWVREIAELEVDKAGVLLGGFGTVQEITEFKEMQGKLEEYSQHLQQLVEQKTQELKEAERLITIGETAGMVGHDIRNPLQSIEGAVYLAKEELKALPDCPEKKELHELVEMIRHQTNYIDHVVADLQDFSRTPLPQLKATNINELVAEALSMIEIPENIQIQTLIEDGLQAVIVDPVFIKRVFLNLIENATHAMPKGGKLTIKAFHEDECTCIHVEDTGIGISEENKPKIFTPLFTTKAKGQGFGLAVCKKLVEAHGGKIIFETEAGKGTVFKIRLPQRKEVV